MHPTDDKENLLLADQTTLKIVPGIELKTGPVRFKLHGSTRDRFQYACDATPASPIC